MWSAASTAPTTSPMVMSSVYNIPVSQHIARETIIKADHQVSPPNREGFPNCHHPSISSHHRLLQDFPHDFQVMYSLWRGQNQMKHHETSWNIMKPPEPGHRFLVTWAKISPADTVDNLLSNSAGVAGVAGVSTLLAANSHLATAVQHCWDIEMASCALLPVRSLPPWVGYEARRWTASCGKWGLRRSNKCRSLRPYRSEP